jgi:hypothetical protein
MKTRLLIIAVSLFFTYQGMAFGQATGSLFGPLVKTSQVNWVNLQWPPSSTIETGTGVNVYARCYEAGATAPAGANPRISVWIGYSSLNTNPNTWTNWIPATHNNQFGDADEYTTSLGSTLPAGIYYYASRLQFNDGTYQYGGYNQGGGGFWDGIYNISGVLAVGKALVTISLINTLQQYDGIPKQLTSITNPAGLNVKVTYNGSSNLPVKSGTYQAIATINEVNYQGSQTGILSIYDIPRDEVSADLRKKFIWVMYDQVYNQSDLNWALSYNPDVISRGWFKWGNTGNFDYTPWSWMVQQSAQKNVLFGGGMTVSVLYPGEVDQEKFLRIVDRDPFNMPIFLNGDSTLGCYLGDFQKKEYLDFLLNWMYKQIDAGAGTLHLDGIASIPATNTGYSDYSMGEFSKFLINKYVGQHNWTPNDSRWVSVFDISFALDCNDGTLSTFDYRKYLVRKGFAKDPYQFSFPLKYEFGVPWNYVGSYSDKRNQEALQYLYGSVKNYADGKGKPILITTNGYSNYTDYQTMGVWDSWSVIGGRLNITPSYVQHWREILEYSMKYLNKDIPLVVFHDWGWGMPFFGDIPPEDQILWLRVYAPEVFASGAIFAWPLSGGGNNYQPTVAVRDTIKSLINWYSENRNLYINSTWISDPLVDLKGQTDLVQTLLDQNIAPTDQSKRVVHLINKKLDGNRKLELRKNFAIQVKSTLKPKSVWAVSPDYSGFQNLDFTYSGETISLTVKSLDAYTIVVIDYKYNDPSDIPSEVNGNKAVEIWPNPCQNSIRIRNMPDNLGKVQVFDILGNMVIMDKIKDNKLDVSRLPAGVYILKLGGQALRFIKE